MSGDNWEMQLLPGFTDIFCYLQCGSKSDFQRDLLMGRFDLAIPFPPDSHWLLRTYRIVFSDLTHIYFFQQHHLLFTFGFMYFSQTSLPAGS